MFNIDEIVEKQYLNFRNFGKTKEEIRNAIYHMNYMKDNIFKWIFASENEDSKKILKYLIESVLNKPVEEITIKNVESPADHFNAKGVAVDLLCKVKEKDGSSCWMNFEVQNYETFQNNTKRLFYYGARQITNQISNGMSIYELLPVIIIMICKKQLPNDNKAFHIYEMKDQDNNEIDGELLKIVLLETEKIKSEKIKELSNLEKMGYMMRYGFESSKNDIIELLKEEEVFNLMENKLEEYLKDEKMSFREIQEAFFEEEIRRNNEYMKKTAIQQGIEQGIELGKEMGIEQSLLNSVLLMMKKSKYSFDDACEYLEVTDEQKETFKKYLEK